jgi:phage tail sheath protein FI
MAGSSYTALQGARALLDAGYDKFTAPLFGGFDGLDITEKEPFRNESFLNASSQTELNNYGINTLRRAIDTVADPEFVEANLMTIPGIWTPAITDKLITTCENRADALAIVDIQHAYTPAGTENTSDAVARRPDVTQVISTLRARAINTSYACTFFPWVQIRDANVNRVVDVPPSVAALGTFGTSQARSELWFAPAGFVRGGLSDGGAGLPVTGVKMRLTSKDRDNLYAANINPIATFPSEGIVIFGQKTLQITRSALDRINVRRLMIFIKKEISRIANGILFDANVQTTWDRFTSAVNPFLADVKARFGLTDFRVILDSTTTTDDLIDRNILYAKIYLKPARAIEFIALDFIITRTGASFDD